MLESGFVEEALNSGIKWRCIKVHGALELGYWMPETEQMDYVVGLAKRLGIPLLFHTGDFTECEAGVYGEVVKSNPEVTFILAHGRPAEQASEVMKSCQNVYAYTAFMPMEDVKRLLDQGLAERLLWGTDCPINRHFFANMTTEKYYQKRLDQFRRIATKEQFKQVSDENFRRVFDY